MNAADVAAAIGDWIATAKPLDALELAIHGERLRTRECTGEWDERTEGARRLDALAIAAGSLSADARRAGLHSLADCLNRWDGALRRWQVRKLADTLALWHRLDTNLHNELDHLHPRSLADAGRSGDEPAPGYADHHHDIPQETHP